VDEEHYEGFHSTREDAIAECVAERACAEYDTPGEVMIVHTGLCVVPDFREEVVRQMEPEASLDNIADALYQESGDWAEGMFDQVSDAAKQELQRTLTRGFLWWATKHHELTAEDLGQEEDADA
jgi:hypothetical protein